MIEYLEHFLNNDKEHDTPTLKGIIDTIEDGELDVLLEKNFKAILNQSIVPCEKFKFNIDTTTIQFEKFKEIHSYYEWLINMDAFNYEEFNHELDIKS